jgi:hypothetical protein
MKTIFKAMSGLPIILGMLAIPAFAVPVTYSTTGEFCTDPSNSSTCTVNPISSGGVTISYTGISSTQLNAPTNASFGTFTVSGAGSITSAFVLTVNQTQPGSGTEQLSSDSFTGEVTFNSNNASVVFSSGTGDGGSVGCTTGSGGTCNFQLGGINYTINATTALVAPNNNGGQSTIQGTIAPEPGFYALTGAGLFGLFVVVLSKKRRVSFQP